jgi:hypothetical protein
MATDVIRSPGQPLDLQTRAVMEARFARDFRHVRVHADEDAKISADMLGARAFTIGHHVVIGAPGPSHAVLAHELAHVVQQEHAPTGTLTQQLALDSSRSLEDEAERAASGPRAGVLSKGRLGVQRKPRNQPTAPLPQKPSAILLQGLTGNDLKDALEVMNAVERVRAVGEDMYGTEFKGRSIRMNLGERDRLIAQTRAALQKSINRVRGQADFALSGYEIQNEVNEDSPVISFLVTTFAGVRDKPGKIRAAVQLSHLLAAHAQGAAAAGNFVMAAQTLAAAETHAKRATELSREYRDGIIGGAESAVTVLEYTRDASFVTLGVLAIIATGGAAAGAAGATTSAAAGTATTALGVKVGTVVAANTIAIGAPIVATTGGALARVTLGEKVDWGQVGLEVATGLVLSKFGGKLSQAMFTRLVGNAAVASVGKIAFGRIVSSVLTHQYSTVFSTIVEQTYRQLRHRDVTWNQFMDLLVDRLTDPKGIVVAGLMGAVQAGADAKLGGARRIEMTERNAPTGEFDAIRAGVIREDKSAQGLNKIDPKTNVPYKGTDEATWAQKQVFDKTVTRMENLKTATATRPAVEDGRPVGSRAYPSIAEVQSVRKYEFAIAADTPRLRLEVEAQLVQLRAKYPDWTFTAKYGAQ